MSSYRLRNTSRGTSLSSSDKGSELEAMADLLLEGCFKDSYIGYMIPYQY